MKKYLTLLALLSFTATILPAQLEITEYPPSFLFNLTDIFSEGDVEVISIDFIGAAHAVGYFENGGTVIDIDEGFILTSGKAKTTGTIYGSHGADAPGYEFAGPDNKLVVDDPDLLSISGNIGNIYDPSILVMTFMAISDQLTIEYVFGSEEYPEYVGSGYNDAFGVFVSGPGLSGPYENNAQNIALLPNSNEPVSINTINHISPLYSIYFHDNDDSLDEPVYDGYIDVFEAKFDVIPYEIYTLKLAVTDVSDHVFDSAIFLKTSTSNPNNAQIATNMPDPEEVFYEGSDTLSLNFDFSDFGNEHFPFTHHIAGSATPEIDYKLNGLPTDIPYSNPVVNLDFIPIKDQEPEGHEYMKLYFISAQGTICTYYLSIFEEIEVGLTNDTTACSIDSHELKVNLPVVSNDYEFSDSISQDIIFVGETISSSVVVENIPFETLVTPKLIKSVCVNIEHSALDNLNLFLISPNGQSLELVTNEGESCDDFVNTCFTPFDTLSITSINPSGNCSNNEQANSTGSFKPEGDWNDLTGATVNGKWTLMIWDDEAGGVGTFHDWTITFSDSSLFQFDFEWSTGDTTQAISISPESTTTYYVTVTDDFYSLVDSVTLNILESSEEELFVQTCATECYTAPDGSLICDEGTFEYYFTAANGCDSIIKVILSHLPTPQSSYSQSICPGDCLTLPDGSNICDPGTYSVAFPSQQGCDSIVTINLTHLPISQTTYSEQSCPSDCIILPDGTSVCDPGNYQVVLTASNGCDSLVTIEYSHFAVPPSEETITICQGTCITAPDGQMICDPGDYQFVLTSEHGCDSIAVIHLNQTPSVYQTINAETCQGGCIDAPDGSEICVAGSYDFVLAAINGCDSIVTVELTTTPPDTTFVEMTKCEGECIDYNNQMICTPGDHHFTVSSAQGCDSAIVLGISNYPSIVALDPVISCDNDCVNYSVSFEITGGDPSSYQVFPSLGTLSGNQFISEEFPVENGYTFFIMDGNYCDTVSVEAASVTCNCITFAGTFDQTSVEVCGSSSVFINHNGNEILGTNEVLCFMLHAGDNIPIAMSSSPSFSFMPNEMSLNTTYFISAVAGNNDGSDCPDFNDPTLDISAGTSVIFYSTPTAEINYNETICEGETTTLEVHFTGNSPWSITLSDGSTEIDVDGITDNPYQLMLSPDTTAEYNLLAVADVNCTGIVSGGAIINVMAAPNVSIDGTPSICLGEIADIQLELEGSPPFIVSISYNGIPGTPLSVTGNTMFFAAAPDSTTAYTITAVTDGNNCTASVMESHTIEVIQPTIATASSNSPICVEDDLLLVSSLGVEYQWSGPDNFTSTEQNPILSNLQLGGSGIYSVIVTDNCFFTDTTTIEVDFSCMFLQDTVDVGDADTLCFSSIISAVNLCDGNNAAIELSIDQQTNCLILEGTQIGVDTICVEIVENGDTISLEITVNVEEPLGTFDNYLNSLVKIYPNPASDQIFIEFRELKIEDVQIFDLMGRRVEISWRNNTSSKMEINGLTAGLYVFQINTSLGIISKKIVVIQ